MAAKGAEDIYEQIALADDAMWTLPQIDDAIAGHRRALHSPEIEIASEGHTKSLTFQRLRLAQALLTRFMWIGGMPNLHEAIGCCLALLESGDVNVNELSLAHALHGVAMSCKFEQNGDSTDLAASISQLTTALELARPECHTVQYLQTQLGRCLFLRLRHAGDAQDLERATELCDRAVSGSFLGHPHRALCLANRARLSTWRFVTTGDTSEAHRATEQFNASFAQRALGHRDRPDTVMGLVAAHYHLYERTSDLNHSERCMQYSAELIQLCPSGHPGCPEALSKRASSLGLRYHRLGMPGDLDEIIHIERQVLKLCQPGHPGRATIMNNLAISLSTRSRRRVNLNDCDEAVALQREAVYEEQLGTRGRAANTVNLGVSLYERFQLLGHHHDLHESIKLTLEGLERLESNDRVRGYAVCNLVGALPARYEATGRIQDLIDAIHFAALRFADSSHSDFVRHGSFSTSTGEAYMQYYIHSGEPNSLMKAISMFSTAEKTLVSDGEPLRPACLHGLSTALRMRYLHTQNVADLDRAVATQKRAIQGLNSADLEYPKLLCGIAHLQLLPNTAHYDPCGAVNLLAEVAKSAHAYARAFLPGLLDALEILETLLDEGIAGLPSKTTLLETYEYASALLPRAANLGLDRRSRLRSLLKADSIGTRAASYALHCGQGERAVELLEETHAVFWTQNLRLRSSVDLLPDNLGNELKVLSRQIEIAQGGGTNARAITEESKEDRVACQRELCRRLDDLLLRIRDRPGMERFMMPDTFQTLSQVASSGPVVIFLHSRSSAFGVIIRAPESTPIVVELPQVNDTLLMQLAASCTSAGLYARGVASSRAVVVSGRPTDKSVLALHKLWVFLMKPIIQTLGLCATSGRKRPRVWLCPTGLFSHLPLHASGAFGKSGADQDGVTTYCIASYTPTLGALLRARTSYSPIQLANAKLLLAAVTQSAGKLPALPWAGQEVAHIRAMIPTNSALEMSHREKHHVTSQVEDVLRHISQASILHLACHGFQRPGNPLESGFVMQDDTLTVSRLMSLNLPNAFLAFLSACESARADAKQPNQAITLASTMLFAGFKSVIGTMWSMGDMDGPMVATKVYGELFKKGADMLDPDAIPYALDEVTQLMRRQGLHAARWATYAHIGM